jgi:hypothetical protein
MKTIIAILLTLCMLTPCHAGMMMVGGGTPAAAAPACPTCLVSESFEGTGYEETWAETGTDAFAILNEDYTTVTPPTGGGSQALRLVHPANYGEVPYSRRTLAADAPVVYVRFYFYLDASSITSGNTEVVMDQGDSSGTNLQVFIQIGNTAGQYYINMTYHDDSGWHTSANSNISIDTWYRVEYLYNDTANTWAFHVDGATIGSGSANLDRGGARIFSLGSIYAGNFAFEAIFDMFGVDTTEWLGATCCGN